MGNPIYKYHVIYTLGYLLQLTNILLTLDFYSESIYYKDTKNKIDAETGYCVPNPSVKATII